MVFEHHDISWYVTECHHVKMKHFWWFLLIITYEDIWWHLMIFGYFSWQKHNMSWNVTECHHDKLKRFWCFMIYEDISWHLMIFGYFSWQNQVVFHDMSWYIMNYHDISPTVSEFLCITAHNIIWSKRAVLCCNHLCGSRGVRHLPASSNPPHETAPIFHVTLLKLQHILDSDSKRKSLQPSHCSVVSCKIRSKPTCNLLLFPLGLA